MSMKNGECDGCTDVGIENCIACIEGGGKSEPTAAVGRQGQTYDDYREGGR